MFCFNQWSQQEQKEVTSSPVLRCYSHSAHFAHANRPFLGTGRSKIPGSPHQILKLNKLNASRIQLQSQKTRKDAVFYETNFSSKRKVNFLATKTYNILTSLSFRQFAISSSPTPQFCFPPLLLCQSACGVWSNPRPSAMTIRFRFLFQRQNLEQTKQTYRTSQQFNSEVIFE